MVCVVVMATTRDAYLGPQLVALAWSLTLIGVVILTFTEFANPGPTANIIVAAKFIFARAPEAMCNI